MAWRGQPLRLRCPLPGAGCVGPQPKIATVERRERSRSPRDMVVARRRRDRKKECACRRSIHPSSGGWDCCCRDGRQGCGGFDGGSLGRRHRRRDRQTRAHQRAAGTKKTALFDIVNEYDHGSRGPRFARAGAPAPCPGRASVSERRPGTQGRHGKIDVACRPLGPGSRFARPGHETQLPQSRAYGVTFPIAGAAWPVQRKPTKPPSAS